MVERIRMLLEARQLTPTQFADAIGIARPIVSHILSGRNKPSLEVVQRIFAAMPDLSMQWLLNGTGSMLATPEADTSEAVSQPHAIKQPPVQEQTATFEASIASVIASKPAPAPSDGRPRPAAGAVPPRSTVPTYTAPRPKRFAPSPPQLVSGPAPLTEESQPAGPTLNVETPSPQQAVQLLAGAEKPIRRIVVFYRDGTFADYQPE